MRGIHQSPVNSPHKGQWRGALMFPLICAWRNGRVNNHEAGDLRRHRAHYDVTVMLTQISLNFNSKGLQTIIGHNFFRWWLGIEQAKGNWLSQWWQSSLTHYVSSDLIMSRKADGRIYASVNFAINVSDNGMSPVRPVYYQLYHKQHIPMINENQWFSFKKMHFKMSSAKWWPVGSGLNVSAHLLSGKTMISSCQKSGIQRTNWLRTIL